MLTPTEIREKTFEKTTFGAYKNIDVDNYMVEISESYSQLFKENSELISKMQVLVEKIEEYRKDEDSLRTALLNAQRLGDNIVKEAKAKADTLVKDASEKANKIISGAQQEISLEQEALETIKSEVSKFREKMFKMYREHIEYIKSLPHHPEDDTNEEAKVEKELIPDKGNFVSRNDTKQNPIPSASQTEANQNKTYDKTMQFNSALVNDNETNNRLDSLKTEADDFDNLNSSGLFKRRR